MKTKRHFVRPKFNTIIILLTASDVFTWAFMYTIVGFVGLYLATKPEFEGENLVEIVGIGTAIYSFVYGLLQVPVGIFVDKVKGDLDEIWGMFIGNILFGLPFLLYPLVKSPELYYSLQILLGIGAAINVVSWRKLFARNLDKDKEGLEYGGYESAMALAIGIYGILIGFIASEGQEYFDVLMVVIGIIMISSTGWIWVIRRKLETRS